LLFTYSNEFFLSLLEFLSPREEPIDSMIQELI